jgi:hypothetical protein
MKNKKLETLAILAATLFGFGGVARAGTFQSIAIDGNFADWSGVPLLYSDPQDSSTSVDYGDIYAANDASFLYIRFSLHASGDASSFRNNFFFDTDNNIATGFLPGGGGHVGSEMLIQSGSGYQEKNGIFNEGAINGLDWLLSPTGTGTDFEIRISRDATYASDDQPVFADGTFSFALEADDGTGAPVEFAPDSGGLAYTFAAVPEPSSFSLLAFGVFATIGIARLRRKTLPVR